MSKFKRVSLAGSEELFRPTGRPRVVVGEPTIEVSDAITALNTAELTLVSESLNADLAALRLLRAAGAFNPR